MSLESNELFKLVSTEFVAAEDEIKKAQRENVMLKKVVLLEYGKTNIKKIRFFKEIETKLDDSLAKGPNLETCKLVMRLLFSKLKQYLEN